MHKLAIPLLALAAVTASAAQASKVYVSSEGGQIIQRMNLDGTNVETVAAGDFVRAMDVDPIGKKVYWLALVVNQGYVMRRSDLDGTNVEDIWPTPDASLWHFRIDPHNGKIYYNRNAADRIWRTNLDGSGREPLVHAFDAPSQVSPKSMAIDVVHDRLYWTHTSPGILQYTNLAGTDPVTEVTTGSLTGLSGIEVDPAGGNVYWKDGSGIWQADLDLAGQTVVIPPPEGQGSGGNNNLRLDLANGDVYWSQQNNGKIWRCNLASCIPQQIGTLSDPRFLALLLPCHDPFEIDGDSDAVHDTCDNCAAEWNREQSDLDSDGEGDRCDVDDGEITVWFGSLGGPGDELRWDAEWGPFWNVYRADLATTIGTGLYTQVPGSNPAADRFCDEMSPALQDGYLPGIGAVTTYLVTGYDTGLETDLDTIGVARPNDNPCP